MTATSATFSCKIRLNMKNIVSITSKHGISSKLTCVLQFIANFRPNLLDWFIAGLLSRWIMVINLRISLNQPNQLLVLFNLICRHIMHFGSAFLFWCWRFLAFFCHSNNINCFRKFFDVFSCFYDVLPLECDDLTLKLSVAVILSWL